MLTRFSMLFHLTPSIISKKENVAGSALIGGFADIGKGLDVLLVQPALKHGGPNYSMSHFMTNTKLQSLTKVSFFIRLYFPHVDRQVSWVKLMPGCQFQSWLLWFQSSFLRMCLERQQWTKHIGGGHHMGDGDGVPGCWSSAGPLLAAVAIWGMFQHKKHFFPSLYLVLCATFQINKIK